MLSLFRLVVVVLGWAACGEAVAVYDGCSVAPNARGIRASGVGRLVVERTIKSVQTSVPLQKLRIVTCIHKTHP